MPVRMLLYDSVQYGEQMKKRQRENKKTGDLKTSAEFLSGLHKGEKLMPVVSVVFYLSLIHIWLCWRADEMEDEQILAVSTKKGLCLFMGCSHRGVVNCILRAEEALPDIPVYSVFAGMHLEMCIRDRFRAGAYQSAGGGTAGKDQWYRSGTCRSGRRHHCPCREYQYICHPYCGPACGSEHLLSCKSAYCEDNLIRI